MYAYAIAKVQVATQNTYISQRLNHYKRDHRILAMPRRCIAAGCNTTSGMGYSLHSFPKDETLRRKWISAVKRQRCNWDGPSSSSLLCSRHFKEDCFVTEGIRFRETLGVPAQKRLKIDAVPTVFAKSTDHLDASSSSHTPCSRPLSERREQRSVSM